MSKHIPMYKFGQNQEKQQQFLTFTLFPMQRFFSKPFLSIGIAAWLLFRCPYFEGKNSWHQFQSQEGVSDAGSGSWMKQDI